MRLASDDAIYEFRDPQKELDLCQLEVWKTFPLDVAPAQNAGLEGSATAINDGIGANGYLELALPYGRRMRADPTEVTTYNPSAANANFSSGDAVTVGAITNDRAVYLLSASTTASQTGNIHIVAKARL